MSKIQGLRVLVKQFLSAAADEIVEAVEKIVAGYEEEMFQSKREISRQRSKMLDALKPEMKLNTITEEAQLNLSVWEKDFLTEQQQEWNSSPRQNNPESLQTERSHKEPLSSSQDRRPEDDTIHDTFTPQCEENEHEIDKVEELPQAVTSAAQMITEAEEEIPSPGFSVAENGDDKDWRLSDATEDSDSDSSEANQDGDSDGSEEWSNSGQHRTQTAKTPRMKKKLKTCIVCKVCGKSFHAKFSLLNHLDIHPKDDCGLCGRHFETEENFKLHLKTHKTFQVNVCNVCGKCFGSRGSLKTHMMSHTGEKPFSCSECGKSFNCHQNMTRHLRIHTGEKPYSCSTCSRRFNDQSTLRRHMQTHLQRTSRKRTLQTTSSTPAVDDGDGNAEVKDTTAQVTDEQVKQQLRKVCKVCGKEYRSMVPFVNHAKTHTEDLLCGVCGTRFDSEQSLKLHLQTHDDRVKVCEICGKRSSQMESHMRTHTGDKPFSCSVCGKSFSIRQNMTRHLRVHTGEKPYSCTNCNKCYSDYTSLKRHVCLQDKILAVTTTAVDNGDAKAEVKAQVTNTQQLRNMCKVCEKEFLSIVSLVNHAKTHTEDLLCGVCGTRSDSGESLKLHLKTHMSYRKVCKICDRWFSCNIHLVDHMRRHTGMKPFSCSVCGKSFSMRHHMIKHLRIHTGVKPYSCTSCNKRYSDKSYFKQHKCCLQNKN